MGRMSDANQHGRLEALRELSGILAAELDIADPRDISQLARQYRQTIAEIAELEDVDNEDDPTAAIIRRARESATD